MSIHQEPLDRVVEGKEDYADPIRKKRKKKGEREIINTLLFLIEIVKKSICLDLSI